MDLSDIGDQVRHLLSTAGRSLNTADPASAVLSRINVVLMVFDNRLYHPDTGRWHNIDDDVEGAHSPDESADSPVKVAHSPVNSVGSASRIARAAATLLAGADKGDGTHNTSRNSAVHVLLLLPPADFLATQVNLPGVAPAAVRPALQLQADSLIPGFDDPLSLAVHAAGQSRSASAEGSAESHMAFWLPTATLNALHQAFADQSLFLAAVMPRPAVLLGQHHGAAVFDDQDSQHHGVLLHSDGVIRQGLQTSLADLEAPDFNEQWQAEVAALTGSAPTARKLHSADGYLNSIQQQVRDGSPRPEYSYAMVPAAALAARHQFDKGKRLWQAAAVIAAVMVVGVIPFLIQSIQLRSLGNTLAEQQELAAPARADQLAVRDFESRWGVLTEFPRQDVPAMLLALQAEVSPNVLTSLELDEGYISIEGESNDPQGLLQQLEMNPMFTEVDFARATSNNRFYIDLRLTTVNFPAYQEWYFPEVR